MSEGECDVYWLNGYRLGYVAANVQQKSETGFIVCFILLYKRIKCGKLYSKSDECSIVEGIKACCKCFCGFEVANVQRVVAALLFQFGLTFCQCGA